MHARIIQVGIVLGIVCTSACSSLATVGAKTVAQAVSPDQGLHADAAVQLGQNNTKSTDRRVLHVQASSSGTYTQSAESIHITNEAPSAWIGVGICMMLASFVPRSGFIHKLFRIRRRKEDA